MINNPYEQYKHTVIETASQEKLIIMLFDEAIKLSKQAKEGIGTGDKYEMANEQMKKAQRIMEELMSSLNFDMGEIADNLYNIYEYIHSRMVAANLKKDISILDEIIKNLEMLKETWMEVFKKVRGGNKATTGGINIEG